MTTTSPVELFVACVSWQEAERIASHLLRRRLIGSAETLATPTGVARSSDTARGVHLIMETIAKNMGTVENALRRECGYTGDFQALPIGELSAAACNWLKHEQEAKYE